MDPLGEGGNILRTKPYETGKVFLSLNKFEQMIPTPILFGVSQSIQFPFQFPTSMDLRMFESGLQMVLYFKGWKTPP